MYPTKVVIPKVQGASGFGSLTSVSLSAGQAAIWGGARISEAASYSSKRRRLVGPLLRLPRAPQRHTICTQAIPRLSSYFGEAPTERRALGISAASLQSVLPLTILCGYLARVGRWVRPVRLYDVLCESPTDGGLGIVWEGHLANRTSFCALVFDQMRWQFCPGHDAILRRKPPRDAGRKGS
jgi:hypothetical protein